MLKIKVLMLIEEFHFYLLYLLFKFTRWHALCIWIFRWKL